MRRVLSSLLLGACLLGVAACGNDTPTDAKADKLDERLLGKGNADPVLTTALEDQIMVDPSLANMANRNAVKAADAPMTAPVPVETTGPSAAAERPATPTLGQIAANQAAAARDKFTGCGLDVDYSMQWANRIPADVPLYPRARVDEAAGSDMPGCQFSYACDGSMARVPSREGWARASRVARAALAGYVHAPVGLATFYHTPAVNPTWNRSLIISAVIGNHIFYPMPGTRGAATVFYERYAGGEPYPGPLPRRTP